MIETLMWTFATSAVVTIGVLIESSVFWARIMDLDRRLSALEERAAAIDAERDADRNRYGLPELDGWDGRDEPE